MTDNSKIEDLRRRIHEDPASIAFAQLAEEYRRAGRYQDAVDACRSGLDLHPDYVSARVTLGRALLQSDRIDEAGAEFERILQTAPQNLAAIRGVAEIHHRNGAWLEALTRYRAARSLAPGNPEIERAIADLSERVSQAIDAHAQARGVKTLSTLEQWLVAIYVTRAQRSA